MSRSCPQRHLPEDAGLRTAPGMRLPTSVLLAFFVLTVLAFRWIRVHYNVTM